MTATALLKATSSFLAPCRKPSQPSGKPTIYAQRPVAGAELAFSTALLAKCILCWMTAALQVMGKLTNRVCGEQAAGPRIGMLGEMLCVQREARSAGPKAKSSRTEVATVRKFDSV